MQHCLHCFISDYEVLDDIGDPIGEGLSLNVIQTHSQIKNVETAEHREITESPSGSQIYEGITSQSLITVTQGSNRKRKAPQITRRSEYCYR